MDLVIDDVDSELLSEDFLLSARFGSVRRQVALTKAVGQQLNFPKAPEGKVPQSIRFDVLTRSGSAWVVLRPGSERYHVTFSGNKWKGQHGLSVRASPSGGATGKTPVSRKSADGALEGSNPFGLDLSSLTHEQRHQRIAQDAKEYLDTHKVISFFHALLHAVIRERPKDPYAFMAAQFPQNQAEATERVPLADEVKRLRSKNEELAREVEDLRRQTQDLTAKLYAAEKQKNSPQSVSGISIRVDDLRNSAVTLTPMNRRPTILDEHESAAKKSQEATPTNGKGAIVKRNNTFMLAPLEKKGSTGCITTLQNSVSFSETGALRAQESQISEGLAKFWARLRGEADASDEFRVLRQSVTTGRWTLYTAGGKATKPSQYSSKRRAPRVTELPKYEPRCPFCVGNETKTPDPLLAFDADGNECEPGELPEGWRVRVIPNIFPLLVTPPGLYGDAFKKKLETIPHSAVAEGKHQNSVLDDVLGDAEDDSGNNWRALFRQVNAVGYSEVVVENSVHNGLIAIVDAQQVALGLRALQSRGRVLVQQPGVRQLLYFKQYGALSGGSLVHPHMQVVTLPLLTPETQNRLHRALDFQQRFGVCSVCQAHIREPLGTGAHSSRLVHKSDNFLVVVPFASNQYRVTIVPLKHSHTWLSISRSEVEELASVLQLVMEGIYHVLDDPEYNIYIFSVDKDEEVCGGHDAVHWLLEIHPRFPAELGGMELASGIRVISGLPEDFAQTLAKEVRRIVAEREVAKRPEPRPSPFFYP